MTLSVYINSDFDRVRIACQDDEACIWIRFGAGDAVSMKLSPQARAAMRAALDHADSLDEIDAHEAINGICVAAEDKCPPTRVPLYDGPNPINPETNR